MRFIFIFISMLLLPAVAFSYASATETGSIFGVVTEKETGDPIAYANIVVEGTALDAFSKDDGSYVITGIPAGEYTVRAMMFG
ncbi:MAG TPA: carboxypeptidase-like regulatory domain-containing protein, partial [Candidatus Eisenbacteria bacterium]|nr:carboxypeptidase-like regulatory domain-containing protein [Candidatus Eisenbacteria bacterium]